MKKSTLFLLPLFFVCYSFTTFGQYKPSVLAKWAPASLLSGKVTVGGEFNFKAKNSVTLMIGIPSSVNHRVDFDGDKSDVDLKAFSVMAGYRYYLGKKPVSGMYIEPYLKYLKHEGNGILEGELDDENARFLTTSKYEGYGLGAQIGAQFLIADKFVIDLFFFGPEANVSNFTVTAVDVASAIPWSDVKAEEAEQDIQDVIDDIPLLKNNTEVTVDKAGKRITTKYDGFLPGFRFGISVGFRF